MGGAESKSRPKTYTHSGRVAERPSPPGKPLLVPSDKHSAEPDVVTIRWEPPLYDGGCKITGYLVEHRRTGSPHWVRSWPDLVRRAELTLSGLEPGWRYQFRVSAQNAVGLGEPGELSDLLTVTLQRTAASAPFFVKELHETIAIENEKAEMTVVVRGTPTPIISWFKDGVEVFSSRSYRVVTDNETSTLVVHQAALSDEGEIKCSATNRVGYTVTRAKLLVEAPPSIRLPRQYEEGLLFEKDEVIRLKVSVAGRPVPEVSWSLNGEPVVGGGRHEVSHAERYGTLRVGEARRSDRGEYTVRAVNRLGEDTASFLVTVADRPMPPGRAKVVMTLGRCVTLSWTTPEDDGGCKIGNYIVEYYRLGWNMWLKAATCRQLTTSLGDLIEGSEYKFRVKAENPYGVSEPSPESDVVFIPDPKRGLLEPPEHGPEEKETLMDMWLEDKKRQKSPSPVIDEQYGERKTKKKRGPMSRSPQRAGVELVQSDRQSMVSEDSMPSPPVTPENYQPIIPRRRGKLEKPAIHEKIKEPVTKVNEKRKLEVEEEKDWKRRIEESRMMDLQEEKELSKKLEERKRIHQQEEKEFSRKLEEMRRIEAQDERELTRKLDEIRKVDEFKKVEEMRRNEEARRAEEMKTGDKKSKDETDKRWGGKNKEPQSRLEHDPMHGSSELMLVLLPHSRATTEERETSKRELFESSLALEDEVAPPMSLSAPELGSGEPPEQPTLRSAFSSTELMHDRAMARFYQEAEAAERDRVRRRSSLQRRQSFERRSSLRSKDRPERSNSLQDIQSLAGKEEPTRKTTPTKTVEVVHGILTIENDGHSEPIVQPSKKMFLRDDSIDSVLSIEDPQRKVLVQQSSAEDMEYEDSSFDEDEDEFEEEEEEPITGEVPDEEELDDEEELSAYDKTSSFYTTSESEEDAQYSYSLDEETYSPNTVNTKYNEDSMISAYEGRGPLILGVSKDTESTEDNTRDEEQPSPSFFEEKQIRSILKWPLPSDNKNGMKVGESIEGSEDSGQKHAASLEKRHEPNFSATKPKPILKVRESSQEKQTPVALKKGALVAEVEPELNVISTSRTNIDDLSENESGTKKKQVRIEEPEELLKREDNTKREDPSTDRRGSLARQRSGSFADDLEAAKVVASHYDDIVTAYGKRKGTPRRHYLNIAALKAAAEKEEENAPELPDIIVSKPVYKPEPKQEQATEPRQELQLSLPEPEALAEPRPVEENQNTIEEPVLKPQKHTVHFEPDVEESYLRDSDMSLPTKKETIPIKIKKRSPSPGILKKRSPSPRVIERHEWSDKDIRVEVYQGKTDSARTSSPDLPLRPLTPTERKIHSYFDFYMDLSLFVLACWLYLFKDERLSIPVMCLMIYRQAHEAFQRKTEALRNKIRNTARRVMFWKRN